MAGSSFADKYAPQRLADIVGQKEAVQRLLFWLAAGRRGRPLMLYGPPGVGKSSVVRALASEKGLDLLELDGSDEKDDIISIIPSLRQASLFRKGKLVAVDGAENASMAAVARLIKESLYPVILIVDDPYHPKLRSLRRECELLELKKLRSLEIEKALCDVCKKEGLSHSQTVLKELSYSAGGDLRAALTDLESLCEAEHFRDREGRIFETLRMIFKSSSLRNALEAVQSCEKDPFEIFGWVDENISAEFADPAERALAFDILSRADMMSRKSRRCVDMLASLSTIRKSSPGFTAYHPPAFYSRSENSEVVEKLAAAMHCSVRTAKRELSFMRFLS
ncbi:MAG: AAA family ATPase [Candidatus Aenigmatarchaeota archaeon]